MTRIDRDRAPSKHAGEEGTFERKITVQLVDSRPWTREALAEALERAGRELLVRQFDDVTKLVQSDPRSGPALVLLNMTGIDLTDSRVSEAVAAARSALPDTPVAVLSDSENANGIMGVIERGASGYLPLSLEPRLAVAALRFVAAGGTFVPPEIFLVARDSLPPPERSDDHASDPILVNALTPRELAVLDRLRRGESNKHIARQLDMREATVKVHMRHIMRKLGAVNRTQAALLAEGLIG